MESDQMAGARYPYLRLVFILGYTMLAMDIEQFRMQRPTVKQQAQLRNTLFLSYRHLFYLPATPLYQTAAA